MFEKYLGRKQSPEVRVETGVIPQAAMKTWQEKASKDEKFKEWFSGSVVSDGEGNPVPVFHATRGSMSFEEIYQDGANEMGVHFGTVATANDRFRDTLKSTLAYKLSPDWTHTTLRARILKSGMPSEKMEQELQELDAEFEEKKKAHDEIRAGGVTGGEVIHPVFLRIVNPVRISDPGSLTDDNLKNIKKDLIQNFIPREQVTSVQQVKSIDELGKTLIALGYDGIVYKNIVEGRDGDSYIPIVGAEQIRSAI